VLESSQQTLTLKPALLSTVPDRIAIVFRQMRQVNPQADRSIPGEYYELKPEKNAIRQDPYWT